MRVVRQVRKSVEQGLKVGLSSGSLLDVAYNVYDEDDLRSSVVPVAPWLYILDYGTPYEPKQLPVILVQLDYDQRALELGTHDSYHFNLALHVLGRTRPERDELASGIMEEVESFPLYTFSSGSAIPTGGSLVLDPDGLGRTWHNLSSQIPQELAQEGTLANWVPLTASFWKLGKT